jgi:membrane protein
MATSKSRRLMELAALLGLGLGLKFWPRPSAAKNARAKPAPLSGTELTAAHAIADLGDEHPACAAPRSWWLILKSVAADVVNHRILAEAAAVTFYALLAIFPALAALISLYGLIADPTTIGAHLSVLEGVIPGGGMQILSDQIHTLTTTPHQALGFGAISGFLISLWSANAGVKSMFDALNAVYGERETRSFLHLTWLSLCFTIGILIFVILAITAVIVLPTVLNYVGLGATTAFLLTFLRWPLLLAGLGLFLAFVYRYGPSRRTAKWHWISWGNTAASIAWIAASLGFSYYVANFGSYNRTYGSLGAAVGFMTWIWISTIIVLTGAELNSELEGPAPAATQPQMSDALQPNG